MSSRRIGQLELIFVSLLYGSLTVTLRVLYSFEGPPTASAVSFARGVLAAACFIPPLLAPRPKGAGAPGAGGGGMTGVGFGLAAAELAFWNLGAQGLLNVGLLYTEAARASFLTQTSVVLTPLVALLAGDTVGPAAGLASALALAGVVLLSQAESGAAAAASAGAWASVGGIGGGDLCCLLGALSWSLYILRLSRFMHRGADPTRLQAWKTCMLAGMYGVWCAADAASLLAKGLPLSALWPGAGLPVAWAVLLYSAVGPGAVADVVQGKAQAKVSASEASVLLAAEPLWAALLALLVLHERLPFLAAVGGGLIVLASLLASGVFGGAAPAPAPAPPPLPLPAPPAPPPAKDA